MVAVVKKPPASIEAANGGGVLHDLNGRQFDARTQ
jgi:hypothetical protein